MPSWRIQRRVLELLTLSGLVIAACAPAAPPSPTAAPKAAEAAKPAAPAPAPAPAAAPAASPASAASAPKPGAYDERAVADFYRGKTVRIIVGFAAGGSGTVFQQILAKALAQYIPGNPSVIVETRPGAGTMIAANSVANTDPK